MSVHRISLNPPQGDELETLEGIIDGLHAACDLANMLSIGADSLPNRSKDAFSTTASLLEAAILGIVDRVQVVAKERRSTS